MLLWPCRIVTPQGTYDPAHFRREDSTCEVLDKQGQVVATLLHGVPSLVAEGSATGKSNVTQRWQVEGAATGVRWLVELTTGCGCGGTVTRETDLGELEW